MPADVTSFALDSLRRMGVPVGRPDDPDNQTLGVRLLFGGPQSDDDQPDPLAAAAGLAAPQPAADAARAPAPAARPMPVSADQRAADVRRILKDAGAPMADRVDGPNRLAQDPPHIVGAPLDYRDSYDYADRLPPPLGTAKPAPNAVDDFRDRMVRSNSQVTSAQSDNTKSTQVDWDYIGRREAPDAIALTAHLPRDRHGRRLDESGVTVAHGFDLGKKNIRYLRNLGIDANTVHQLTPYLGSDGIKYLETHPLTISPTQVESIDRAVRQDELGHLVRNFDRASKIGHFSDLPSKTQTAIASVFFQLGTRSPATAAPDLWNQITTGNWNDAHSNLMHFGGSTPSRHRLAANLISQDIESGALQRH